MRGVDGAGFGLQRPRAGGEAPVRQDRLVFVRAPQHVQRVILHERDVLAPLGAAAGRDRVLVADLGHGALRANRQTVPRGGSFALGHPVQLGLAEGHVRRGDAPDAVHIAQGDVPRDAVGVELDAAPAPRADGGQRKIAPKRRAVLGGHGGRLIVVVVVVVVLVRVRLRLRARFERVLVRAPQARVVGRSDARRGLDASRRSAKRRGEGGRPRGGATRHARGCSGAPRARRRRTRPRGRGGACRRRERGRHGGGK